MYLRYLGMRGLENEGLGTKGFPGLRASKGSWVHRTLTCFKFLFFFLLIRIQETCNSSNLDLELNLGSVFPVVMIPQRVVLVADEVTQSARIRRWIRIRIRIRI